MALACRIRIRDSLSIPESLCRRRLSGKLPFVRTRIGRRTKKLTDNGYREYRDGQNILTLTKKL